MTNVKISNASTALNNNDSWAEGMPAADTRWRAEAVPPRTPALSLAGGSQNRRHLPTDWPRVGGREFQPQRTDLFLSEAFRDLWRPGETREIYAGACDALCRIARQLHLPAYKVSTCGKGRVWQRMRELRFDRYGAAYHHDGSYVVDNLGWDDWFPSQLHPRLPTSPNSPVRRDLRAIVVLLPDSMTPSMFDKAFDAEARKGALDAWLMTQAGRDHCAAIGFDFALAQRFTCYAGGSSTRLSPAAEICGFSIWGGADRLSALAETIILRHLRLIA